MADNAHIYIGLERLERVEVAGEFNLSEARWVQLNLAVRALEVIGGANQYELQTLGNNDTFEHVADDPETETNEQILVSNIYIYEARWAFGEITAENVKALLANTFTNVEPEEITYTISRPVFAVLPTVVATYYYDGDPYIRIALFGCVSGADICTWHESGIEVDAHIAANIELWNGVGL